MIDLAPYDKMVSTSQMAQKLKDAVVQRIDISLLDSMGRR